MIIATGFLIKPRPRRIACACGAVYALILDQAKLVTYRLLDRCLGHQQA